MITKSGYSKDPNIVPEGIVITFGQQMMKEQGGVKKFISCFLESMNAHEDGSYWMHKCSNLPGQEVDIIYIIVLNRLWAKVKVGNNQIEILDAIDGWGDNIPKEQIEVIPKPPIQSQP